MRKIILGLMRLVGTGVSLIWGTVWLEGSLQVAIT